MSELVMVVRTVDLRPHFTARLIRDHTQPILEHISLNHFFIDRQIAEVSEHYRQIIPYVVIRSGEDYFVLKRTPKQTEARLHHKLSLGIGGHINPGQTLVDGLRKELEEEVRVEVPYDLEFVGILNDESTEVSRVHLGIVYLLTAVAKNVAIVETGKMSGEWMSRNALRAAQPAMESWSQIIYDELIA